MRIGVTGHQRLEHPEAWYPVARAIRELLGRFAGPLTGVTSLAIGADQLFAQLVLARGGELHAVLPFAGIERTFAAADVPAYRGLADRATVEVLAPCASDEDAFLAAGERVVELSDLLVAVWNGRPAKGKGGTADVVAYALGRRVPLVHVEPAACGWAPRGGRRA